MQGFRPYPGREAQKARSQVARVCAHWLVPNKCTYRLLHCPTGRVYESRDVVFVEGDTSLQPHQVTISVDPIPAFPDTPAPAPAPENSVPTPKFKVMVEDVPDEGEVAPPPPSSSDVLEGPPEHDIKAQPLPAEPVRRSTCVRKPPVQDDDPRYKVSSYNQKCAVVTAPAASVEGSDMEKTSADASDEALGQVGDEHAHHMIPLDTDVP